MADVLRIGSLFSGIGGLELGVMAALQRLGAPAEVAWQCEKDRYARAVLRKHWSDTPCFEDVHDVDADAPPVDLICGGFPCQDLSIAGKRAGLDGTRSGLWSEFARVIRVLRPRLVLVENVPELLAHLGRVLGPLAACGYDAQWDVFSAAEVGAPHLRERLFILAYADGVRIGDAVEPLSLAERGRQARAGDDGRPRPVADADSARQQPALAGDVVGLRVGDCGEALADALQSRRPRATERAHEGRDGLADRGAPVGHAEGERRDAAGRDAGQGGRSPTAHNTGRRWPPEPDVGRVVDGPRTRLDGSRRRARLRCLGNGVVPQTAELALLTLAARAGLLTKEAA